MHSDAFAGGFLAGLVQDKPLRESIDIAQWLGSLNVKSLGPRFVLITAPKITTRY